MCAKGGQITPSHYKDKQSLEQKDGVVSTERPLGLDQFELEQFEGNGFKGPRSVPKTEWQALNEWAEWLNQHGLPKLCLMPIRQKAENRNLIFFWLPSKTPPTSPKACADAVRFFTVLLDCEANSYAAQ